MIDAERLTFLIDARAKSYAGPLDWRVHQATVDAITEAVNEEIERIVRVLFERFGRDYTAQDIAAVLGKPEPVASSVQP